MTRVTLKEIERWGEVDVLYVRCIDLALYTAYVEYQQGYYAIKKDANNYYRRYNLNNVREDFENIAVKKAFLVHDSAYDEMVAQPLKSEPNTLCVPLSMKMYR